MLTTKEYNFNKDKYKAIVAKRLFKNSPLRSILGSICRVENRKNIGLHKRMINNHQTGSPFSGIKKIFNGDVMAIGAAVGMSGPAMVGMVQAVSTPNMTAQDRSDMFIKNSFDMAANILMFAGGLPGIAIGSAWMITNTFFDAFEGNKGPPQVDPNVLYKQIIEYIQYIQPAPLDTYMQIKGYVQELVETTIDNRLMEQYRDNAENGLRIIAQHLNIYDGEEDGDTILNNWKELVVKTADLMLSSKLPVSVDDSLNSLKVYEIGIAVAIYPQFISMLLLALKEWYITAKQLEKPTANILAKYNAYLGAFRKQYDIMVNKWYTDSKENIMLSHFERVDSASCMLTVKYPGEPDKQGTIEQSDAASKYEFNKDTAMTVQRIQERNCRDAECRFVTLLERNDDSNRTDISNNSGKRVCSYEKIYKSDCEKPCSKAKQAMSFIFPIFGVANTKCFKNSERCTYTPTELKLRPETCKPSNCSIQFDNIQNALLAQLEKQVQVFRKNVVKYDYLLKNATITEETSFIDGLEEIQSLSLQEFIPKDEVFNGALCNGKLAIPTTKNVPKMCVVSQMVAYSCPTTVQGRKQYILYPDVIRSQLPVLCPTYIRHKKDIITKDLLEKTSGQKVSDQQFLIMKAAHERKKDINNPKGVKPVAGTNTSAFNSVVGDINSVI